MLIKLIKQHVELLGISPLMDSEFSFRNPILKIATFLNDKIRFQHKVCFEGQTYNVFGNEIKIDLMGWEFEEVHSSKYMDFEERDSHTSGEVENFSNEKKDGDGDDNVSILEDVENMEDPSSLLGNHDVDTTLSQKLIDATQANNIYVSNLPSENDKENTVSKTSIWKPRDSSQSTFLCERYDEFN